MSIVITANMLATGRVVFLGADDAWVENIDEAFGYESDDAAEEGLAIGRRDQDRSIVVDPFVTSRGAERDGQPAMTLRDSIRAYGPTIKFCQTTRAAQG